jgi:hypothetical protein
VCLQCGASADPNCPLVEMHAVEECR